VVAGDEHIVYVDSEKILEVLGWLRDEPAHRFDLLKDLTAVDYGTGTFLQVVYELWSIPHRRQLRIKVELPMGALEIDSAYYLWRSADWMEREVFDMFGIVFRGHPDLRRILMPYNYAEGHPLRKDFPLRGRFSRAEQTRRALSMKTEDHYSPREIEVAKRLHQPLPDVMVDGGPGEPNPGMPGVGGR
jgi:NADH-quinone oxidoreductase subunit C